MIVYDSRKVKKGDTFVAIPGLKKDGTEYIPQAIASGALAIVAEKAVAVPPEVKLTVVPSARKALAELAAEYYGEPSKKLKLIGVTGTKGKTTVAYLIRSILETAGFKTGIIGTIDSPMTTPEAVELQAELARLVKEGYTHCVLEVSSHGLAQERVHGCHFSVAIFTNLTHDHLDYHKTMDEYLAAKKKLFAMLNEESTAIINIDDPCSASIIGVVRGEVIPFGLEQTRHELRSTKHNEFDAVVSSVDIKPTEMIMKINSAEIRTPLIGLHNAYNIMAAFQCGLSLGIRSAVIKAGVEKVKIIPGRQEEIIGGQLFRIIVDFAHSPDSLQKLLETYRQFTAGRLILVFGCPGERDREKRAMMGTLAARLADFTIITTDDPHGEEPEGISKEIEQGFLHHLPESNNYVVEKERRQAITRALTMAGPGDIVLIAGRGHEQYQDFQGKKIELDDRAACREIISSLVSKGQV